MNRIFRWYWRIRRRPWVEGVETVGLALVLSFALRLMVMQAFYIPSRSMADTLQPYDHILAEKLTYCLRVPHRGEIVIFDFTHAPGGGMFPGASAAQGSDDHEDSGAYVKSEVHSTPGPDHREFVKRVIAIAGDVVDFSSGELKVNGRLMEEPYVRVSSDGLSEASSRAAGSGAWALRLSGRRLGFTKDGVLIDGRALDSLLTAATPADAITDRSPSNFVRLVGGGIGVLKIRVPEGRLYVMGDNRPESADSRWFGLLPVTAVHGRAFLTYWPVSRFKVLS